MSIMSIMSINNGPAIDLANTLAKWIADFQRGSCRLQTLSLVPIQLLGNFTGRQPLRRRSISSGVAHYVMHNFFIHLNESIAGFV